MVLKERTNVDRELSELIGDHISSGTLVSEPVDDDVVVEPAGMTIEEEAELVTLLSLADPNLDGDEQAAIERLRTRLLALRERARRR